MNKETRTFIWGMILLVVCVYFGDNHLTKIISGDWNWWNLIATIIYASGIGHGLNLIDKTIIK